MRTRGLILANVPDAATGPADHPCAAPLQVVANRPIVHHVLDAMARGGIREVGVVVDPHGTAAVEDAVGDGGEWGLDVCYLPGEPADGLPAALAAAEEFLADDAFLLQHGDGLLRGDLAALVHALEDESADALLLMHRNGARAALRHGAAHALPAGDGLSVAGAQLFGSEFLSRARPHLPRRGRDADVSALVDAVRREGGRVSVRVVEAWCRYEGDPEQLLEMNRLLLDDLPGGHSDLPDCIVEGRVVIHPSAEVASTVIRGPAVIGKNARVVDAYIGPYTSIGDRVSFEGAEIEHSIVLSDAEIRHIRGRIEGSVVGHGARVVRDFSLPRGLRLRVGAGAQITLR
jgi:glucose-1-phosphate thymidylyltransferase